MSVHAAVEKLAEEGLAASMEQLDVADEQSIKGFVNTIKSKYGGVDCLVNNAGFAFPRDSTEPVLTQAKTTCGINYFGVRKARLSEHISPLFRKGSRVVNVASTEGQRGLAELKPELRHRLMGRIATPEGIDAVVNEYLQACEKGVLEGWTSTTYRMSKAAVIALTAVLARIADENPEKQMIYTCCCPATCSPKEQKKDSTNLIHLKGVDQKTTSLRLNAWTAQGGAGLTWEDGRNLLSQPQTVPIASKEHHGKFVTKEGINDLREN
ncbi:hypothetical protein Esti_002005 [Eimeria stiedai]